MRTLYWKNFGDDTPLAITIPDKLYKIIRANSENDEGDGSYAFYRGCDYFQLRTSWLGRRRIDGLERTLANRIMGEILKEIADKAPSDE